MFNPDLCFVSIQALLDKFQDKKISEKELDAFLKSHLELGLWMLRLPVDEPPVLTSIPKKKYRSIQPLTAKEQVALLEEEAEKQDWEIEGWHY